MAANYLEVPGELRRLSVEEDLAVNGSLLSGEPQYKFVVTAPYAVAWRGKSVAVPAGFLVAGSPGCAGESMSRMYRKFLYATHAFSDAVACERLEADLMMSEMMAADGHSLRAWFFYQLARVNPFGLFSKAWESSGARGAQFLVDFGLDLGDADGTE